MGCVYKFDQQWEFMQYYVEYMEALFIFEKERRGNVIDYAYNICIDSKQAIYSKYAMKNIKVK
jgi:hypothetical protein